MLGDHFCAGITFAAVQRYTQVVKNSAFVSAGSLLDHVYIRESSLDNFKDVKCEVKSVYYSDHDCLQICL